MSRRTKREMESMKNEVTLYLLSNKLDPHKAHEQMIKEYLESGHPIPYYVKGVKDFIKVSQVLAVELNRKEQMKKADQERYARKEEIINYIMGISKDTIKEIYKQYKNSVSQSDKINIVNVYTSIYNNSLTKNEIDQSIINTFSNIYNEQIQPA